MKQGIQLQGSIVHRALTSVFEKWVYKALIFQLIVVLAILLLLSLY